IAANASASAGSTDLSANDILTSSSNSAVRTGSCATLSKDECRSRNDRTPSPSVALGLAASFLACSLFFRIHDFRLQLEQRGDPADQPDLARIHDRIGARDPHHVAYKSGSLVRVKLSEQNERLRFAELRLGRVEQGVQIGHVTRA